MRYFAENIFRGTEPLYQGTRSLPFTGLRILLSVQFQEMQRMDCDNLNSAEYFQGPSEVTDEEHLLHLMMSRKKPRMDERKCS